jgi:hypothetical protein
MNLERTKFLLPALCTEFGSVTEKKNYPTQWCHLN